MSGLNILVLGTGMYVCGRGTEGYGTIMPAILEFIRKKPATKIHIVGQSQSSLTIIKDKNQALMQRMKLSVPINYYQSLEQGLDKLHKPACAIIAVPDHLHASLALQLIRQKIHCLVVKPLAPTLNEVRQLIDAQQKYQVYGIVEFHKRWDEANLKLKSVLSSGDIGLPLFFHVEFSQRKSMPLTYFKKWIEHTNIFQ